MTKWSSEKPRTYGQVVEEMKQGLDALQETLPREGDGHCLEPNEREGYRDERLGELCWLLMTIAEQLFLLTNRVNEVNLAIQSSSGAMTTAEHDTV